MLWVLFFIGFERNVMLTRVFNKVEIYWQNLQNQLPVTPKSGKILDM